MASLSIIFKDRILSQHQLNKELSFSIGSDPGSQIFIDSLIFSAHHASIYTEDNKYIFELTEGSTGFINNEEIKEKLVLKDAYNIEVGKFTLRFLEELELSLRTKVETPFEAIKKNNKSYWLQFLNGSNVGKTIKLTQNITNIGKAGTARVVVSKQDEDYYVSHLDGINNARVNSQTIGEKTLKLSDNATLELGQIKMLFYVQEKPE